MNAIAQFPSTSFSLLVRLRDAADDQAWRTCVDVYSPLVFGYARRRGLQEADAQDVVQQVFAQVVRGIRTFEYDPQRGTFRGWLGTITGKTISRHLDRMARPGRAQGQSADEPTLDCFPSQVEPAWIDDFNRRICQVAQSRIQAEFDPQVWRAFELTWLEDRQPPEVAATLGKSAAWVYKAKFKVLKRLKQEIDFLSNDTAYFS